MAFVANVKRGCYLHYKCPPLSAKNQELLAAQCPDYSCFSTYSFEPKCASNGSNSAPFTLRMSPERCFSPCNPGAPSRAFAQKQRKNINQGSGRRHVTPIHLSACHFAQIALWVGSDVSLASVEMQVHLGEETYQTLFPPQVKAWVTREQGI